MALSTNKTISALLQVFTSDLPKMSCRPKYLKFGLQTKICTLYIPYDLINELDQCNRWSVMTSSSFDGFI